MSLENIRAYPSDSKTDLQQIPYHRLAQEFRRLKALGPATRRLPFVAQQLREIEGELLARDLKRYGFSIRP